MIPDAPRVTYAHASARWLRRVCDSMGPDNLPDDTLPNGRTTDGVPVERAVS
jgi:hypothetical protein